MKKIIIYIVLLVGMIPFAVGAQQINFDVSGDKSPQELKMLIQLLQLQVQLLTQKLHDTLWSQRNAPESEEDPLPDPEDDITAQEKSHILTRDEVLKNELIERQRICIRNNPGLWQEQADCKEKIRREIMEPRGYTGNYFFPAGRP